MNADQRYYASSYGRFNTADPYQASAGPADPGSWNRYSYTRGDPVNRVDPRGLEDEAAVTFSATGYGYADPALSNLDLGYMGLGMRGMVEIDEPPSPPSTGGGLGGLTLGYLTGFNSALDEVVDALRTPQCAELFGLSKNSMDPVDLLNTLVSSSEHPSIGYSGPQNSDQAIS